LRAPLFAVGRTPNMVSTKSRILYLIEINLGQFRGHRLIAWSRYPLTLFARAGGTSAIGTKRTSNCLADSSRYASGGKRRAGTRGFRLNAVAWSVKKDGDK
jgi:hypothetical protein